MKLSLDMFPAFHSAVHGQPPFGWQSRLLERIVTDRRWPRVLDLPTGAGKTTCLDIALFALALDAASPPAERWCPRRIAMVVDRRIVVDQVAERGRKLLRALTGVAESGILLAVADALRALCPEGEAPLGVFTLRGGIPKDDGWTRTPDQPLILASTVDQIGSRLLFQGYGVSRGMRPVHAGLLGNDLLLLLDEVHLSTPFAETLDALAKFRQRFEQGSTLPVRRDHVFLSATPGATTSPTFRLEEAEQAPSSPLGRRLNARKMVRLEEVPDRAALGAACVSQASDLLRRHDVIAVIVNRVASALAVARALRQKAGVEITLLTGRMRPLDRDDVLRRLRPRVMTGRERPASAKLVVVGTQCLEAGADFDFDALVTESASLDALRQRFGRVDRLGKYESAEGVVVHDKSGKDDPIYRTSAAATVTWLKRLLKGAKKKEVDFGVRGLPVPSQEEMAELVAPREHAPVLLPAYLDLWVQTSPVPASLPDLGLWLHGPDSGPADVQVIWRADLSEQHLARDRASEQAGAIVGAIPPTSLEAVSLPFAAARRWLSDQDPGDVADVEGLQSEDDAEGTASRTALRWQGEVSDIIDAMKLRPGDTIVVPASRGGLTEGCFDPDATTRVEDLAERGTLMARGRAVLRLHGGVLMGLGLSLPLDDDMQAVRRALATLAEEEHPQTWRRIWLQALSTGKRSVAVPVQNGWTVLEGRRVTSQAVRTLLEADESVEDGVETTTDDEDSIFAARAVALSDHSADVESFVRSYGRRLGLRSELVEDLALAGWLHDIGKADPRFQVLLRGGDMIEYYKDETPLAKSAISASAVAAHRLARGRSGYPPGTRHEIQSLAMVDRNLDEVRRRASDPDLVQYLIASHHGYARPFVPVVFDEEPVEVSLPEHTSAVFGCIAFRATTSRHELHRIDSSLSDRFWRLVNRYGWQGLCWLEAILRLADHRASEWEQREEERS